MAEPSPAELWQQADGDSHRYMELLREHGMALKRGDEGFDDQPEVLPCGWPGRSDEKETRNG